LYSGQVDYNETRESERSLSPSGDASARPHGPSNGVRDESTRVVTARIALLPGGAIVGRDVRAGCSSSEPSLRSGKPGDGGTKTGGGRSRRRRPCFSAIGGDGDVIAGLRRLGVIAPDGDTVQSIP